MHPMMPIILQRAWASKKISDAGRKGKKTMGEAVRQMFAAIAQHYDLLNTVLSFGLHHCWRQQAVTCSSVPPGARLLDVCSGTADLALAFARHLGHDGQVIATDFCRSEERRVGKEW